MNSKKDLIFQTGTQNTKINVEFEGSFPVIQDLVAKNYKKSPENDFKK
jgi:hypothetical protein